MRTSELLCALEDGLANVLARHGLGHVKRREVRTLIANSLGYASAETIDTASPSQVAEIANGGFDRDAAANTCQRLILKSLGHLISTDELTIAFFARSFHYPLSKPSDLIAAVFNEAGEHAGIVMAPIGRVEHSQSLDAFGRSMGFVDGMSTPAPSNSKALSRIYREWDSDNCGGTQMPRALFDLNGEFLRTTRRQAALDVMLNRFGYFPEVSYTDCWPIMGNGPPCYMHGGWNEHSALIAACGAESVAALRAIFTAYKAGHAFVGSCVRVEGELFQLNGGFCLLDGGALALTPTSTAATVHLEAGDALTVWLVCSGAAYTYGMSAAEKS